ncbi:hypothetical protein C8F01DRAFT_394040 [Mycena amicta]|nr:hypothetical protein C8F01DRAFT_394040 [Mycena amicta]
MHRLELKRSVGVSKRFRRRSRYSRMPTLASSYATNDISGSSAISTAAKCTRFSFFLSAPLTLGTSAMDYSWQHKPRITLPPWCVTSSSSAANARRHRSRENDGQSLQRIVGRPDSLIAGCFTSPQRCLLRPAITRRFSSLRRATPTPLPHPHPTPPPPTPKSSVPPTHRPRPPASSVLAVNDVQTPATSPRPARVGANTRGHRSGSA